MASFDKFTDAAMRNMIRHNCREMAESKNKNIDPERTHLNYSFSLNHGKVSEYSYYKNLLDHTYIYGRGSSREANAITGCEWVVTLPKELSEDAVKQSAFFKEVYSFISERYGEENIINNAVHYDEGGLPHLHVIFCPITELDHTVVQHKSIRTKHAIKLDSGRYEYVQELKYDENGDLIPINNYARMSDYYDTKLDCNTVMNKAELQHFHTDLQQYLNNHGIEGKVITGTTRGINYSVKSLKEFTQNTGLHLSDLKEIQSEKSVLESVVKAQTDIKQLQQIIAEKDALIESLQEDLTNTKQHIKELEAQTTHTWGQPERSTWGQSIEWDIEN